MPPIEELIPHRGRMRLIDELLRFEEGRATCRVRIRDDSTFVDGGRVDAVVTLEYMAQAVAAYAGARDRAAGRPVSIGYLLGTRELTLAVDHLDVGDELLVEVEPLWADELLAAFACTVRRGEASLASATLNVYQGSIEGRAA